MVLYKHRYRQDHGCICCFNRRLADNEVVVAIFLNDNMTAIALDKFVIRKEDTDFNQAGGDSLRTN